MAQQVTNVNQLSTSDGRLYAHKDCALCVSLGEAVDAGLPRDETIASMERWYATNGDSPYDGTGCTINALWLRSEGLDAAAFTGDMSAVDSYLAKGWRVCWLIRSNTYGYPYSGAGWAGHFVEVCYANGDGTYTCMQPVGGITVRYSRDLLIANGQNAGVVVRHDYRSTGVTTVITDPKPVPMGEIDMQLTKIGITITTDPNGDGYDNQFESRNIPWSSVFSATLNGTDPAPDADKSYPRNGTARYQQRDGKTLVEVVGCQPNAAEVVWLTVAQ